MVSVGVLIDLWWRPQAGGHVKCWERFAEAAIATSPELDLTLYFLGDRPQTIEQSERVRYVIIPPLFSTRKLFFLRSMSEHTDLAPLNPTLFRRLKQHDLFHATHPSFTLGQTARWVADRAQIPQSMRSSIERKLEQFWQRCKHVLVSQPDDYDRIAQFLPTAQISYLRRGLDRRVFHPKHRDRDLLQQRYGIALDRFVLLYVGRLDACKNVMRFAETVRLLLDRGYPVHTLMAGQGDCADEITALLGSDVTRVGTVPQSVLSSLYASADLFVFPSETEIHSNAVLEAKASGLPVLVSNRGGTAQMVQDSGKDGLVIESQDTIDWALAIVSVMEYPDRLAAMRRSTYEQSQKDVPTWEAVLMQDLYPVWKSVVLSRRGTSSL